MVTPGHNDIAHPKSPNFHRRRRPEKLTSLAVLLSLSCRCSTPALTLIKIFDRRSCLYRTRSSLATLLDSSSS